MSTQNKPAGRSGTKRRRDTSRRADALALLTKDHKLVKSLFDSFGKARSNDRKAALSEKICEEVLLHAQIEEELFYPAAREVLRSDDLLDEAAVEHASARSLIEQIQESRGNKQFEAKVKVLGEYIAHHVREEQGEIFPRLRKSRLDLKQLGERMETRKLELKRNSASEG